MHPISNVHTQRHNETITRGNRRSKPLLALAIILSISFLSTPAFGVTRLFTGAESGYCAVLGQWYDNYKAGPMAAVKIGLQADRYTLTELHLYYSPHDGNNEGTKFNILSVGLGARFRVAPLNPMNPYVYVGASAARIDEMPKTDPTSETYSGTVEWTTDWMVGLGGEVNIFRKTTLNYGPVFHFTRAYYPDESDDENSEGYMAVDLKLGINYYF